MKLKVPPAIVFLVFGVFMYVLNAFLPVGNFNFFGQKYLIIALVIISGSIGIMALLQFYKSKTTVDPLKPSKATQLVTSGIYQFSRNPMYLGLLLLLLAWGLWLGNAFNILIAAAYVSYMNKFQIEPEEEILTSLFGKEYTQYCILVRRWF